MLTRVKRLSNLSRSPLGRGVWVWLTVIAAVTMAACSSTKHVPQGEYLLDKVKIEIEDSPKDISSLELTNYLRQLPNHKVLGFWKLQLGMYSLSGADSTRWYNRWLRSLGQPPVVLNEELTSASANQLRLALINKGYMGANVSQTTTIDSMSRKARVTYKINAGTPHKLHSLSYNISDSAMARIIMADSARFLLSPGSLLDRNLLDNERTLIANRLRNHGYYAFTKEYITFEADTALGSHDVDLTLVVNPPRRDPLAPESEKPPRHLTYRIGRVMFITDYSPGSSLSPAVIDSSVRDTVDYRGIEVVYGDDRYIRPGVLKEHCFITPGNLYSSYNVDRTYESLAKLPLLKSINIELRPAGATGRVRDNEEIVDAYIMLTRNKKQGMSFEIEGTNSEGDLGFGAGIKYNYRNLGHASNLLTAKIRMNYESLSGNLSGLIHNHYTEWAGEVGITFPKFLFPFLSHDYRRRVNASTEVALSASYQERPEYTRIIAGAALKYKWTALGGRERRTFDLVDVNYVRLPESTINFIEEIAPDNPLLRYSYEDHFIMRSGYTYYRTNRRIASGAIKMPRRQPLVYSVRAAGEIAGNLLYAISALTGSKRSDGVYKIFGIQYAQYAKAEVDYTLTRNFSIRNQAVAFHVGAGVAVPYANSSMVPFEKRFYAGGANGVRGWSVRTLGPGEYDGRNSVTDFINQCGDIRLDLSLEYRLKLFWVVDGAAFIDAGNIWTIRNYPNQPGGVFRVSTFYKQIALAYGLGLRLDFDYFLLRFDLGMKAHNPARGREPWPLIHPDWHRDATFHFAVGYPF